MIPRTASATLKKLETGFYVVTVTGPRQSGKTTLVQSVFKGKKYVSLEDPDEKEFAESDPRRFLERFSKGGILDEIQRCPDLFHYLQGIVDQNRQPGQFILTGSQQFGLITKITQSLAGRTGMLELLPFSLDEVKKAGCAPKTVDDLLLKGLYPPLYDRPVDPVLWFKSYMQTYIERDLRQIVNIRDLSTFQRFIRMCAARVGQILNLSSLASDCGISHNTAKAWISILEASYIIFLLKPHYKNYNKRLIKRPKLYFFDTGFAGWLQGITNIDQMNIHPSRGALFENWVISELLKHRFNYGFDSNIFFWRDNTGNEVDVIVEKGTQLIAIEIKSGQSLASDAFKALKKWLKLSGKDTVSSFLCYGGNELYQRSEIEVVPWNQIDIICSEII